LDPINRFLLHDRLDTLQAARKRRDPIRIAQAKDAVRALMEHGNLPAELFEQAVLALIDPSGAHAYGAQWPEAIPYRWPGSVDAESPSSADRALHSTAS
jgi:hypothetical protein